MCTVQPSLAKVGSLEELVARVGGDLSSLRDQVHKRLLLVSCSVSVVVIQ